MRRTRTLLATAVAALTLGGVALTPALAGYTVELSSDIDCDTTTGEWVVTYTYRANDQIGSITGTYVLSGGPSGEAGELTFAPLPVSEGEPATATIRLPGSSTGTLVGSASDDVAGDEVQDVLDGSCAATPVSTTTTSTTAPAVDPVPARPAYTG